jgi:hypothetical protein
MRLPLPLGEGWGEGIKKVNTMSTSHQPFDDTTKAFYHRFFENLGLEVETERQVFFRGRSIDIVVKCPEEQKPQLQNTVFCHFRQLNAIELKGIHDPLTLADYNRIMMRAWGLGGLEAKPKTKDEAEEETEEIEETESDELKYYRHPNQRTLTIVCVTRPNKILNQLQNELKFQKTNEPGIYHCEAQIQRWIIVPSELELVPKNYPLLPLARGEKLEQFLSLCLNEGLVNYLQLIKDIGLLTDPELIWRKILEVQQMRPQIREETWSYIDQFFREVPEGLRKIPSFQEALNVSEQRGEERGEEWGQRRTQQRMLIRLLRRKFEDVPNSLIEKIEATEEMDLLDQWFEQVISADSLAKTGLIDLH